MKYLFTLIPVLFFLAISFSLHAQKEGHNEVAIYEPEFVFLQKATSNFVVKYSFNPEEFNFKETSKKTILWLTPDCDLQKIVKTLPKGAMVKSYKFFPETQVYAAQFENSWGFIGKDDLKDSEKYATPVSDKDLDSPPVLLNSISAKYPSKAKSAGIMGDVMLKVHISNTGAVTKVLIEKSIPQLDSAAMKAVKKLRFKPARKFGLPVDVWVRFPVQFRLDK